MVDRGMIDAILEATPDIMIILNRDGTVWYCTEKVRGLGWTAAELLGMPFEVLIPESMRAEALTTIANDLKSHGIADIMIPIERKGMAPVDLSLRWIEFSGADGVEGAVILLSAAPAAALTSEYLAIFRHLLTSTTMDDFLDKVLDEVKGLPIDSVTTYEYSPELNQFSVVHSWVRGKDVRRDGLIIPHNYTHLSGVVGTGRPIIRPSFDREEHLFPIDTLHRDDGIRADASYPLVVRGKVRGAVTFGSFQSDHFTPALRNTMELLADVISGFLEKEAETRRIEARSAMYRVLAESVDQPMASVARDGTIRFANPAFRDLIGGGKGIIFELVTGDVREAFFELIEATADGGRDSREVNIDGRPHLIETIGQVEGEVIHLIVHDLQGEREIETFRTVVENLPHPVIVIDDGGWITHTSEAARKLFGRLEGKPLEDALPDLADLMGREPAIGEITLDMRRYRVQCQRAVGHHVCAIIDVTDWVARDDAVGRELDRLRSTFEALSRTGLALIRTSGDRIVEWPEEATALTGIEAKGEDVFEALHIDREAAEEALREGVFTAVVEIPGGDGSVHTQVHMVRWRGDILAVLQDHTAEKRLQERLREYARGLEERIEEIEGEREDVTRRTGTALDALKGAIEEAAAAFRDIVYLRDASGNILYLSPSGREVLGVRSLPVSVTGLLADPDVDASRLLSSESEVSDRTPAFIDVNAPSGTLTLEIYERKVSGERLARELERDGRAPAGPIFLGVARDITRRIEMERQIETYTARLEESAKRAEETLTRQMEEMAFFQGLTMDLARAEAPGEAGEHLLDWAAKWLASGPHALYLVNADTGRYDLIAHRGIDAARAERFAVLHPDILRARDLVEGKVPITFRPRERDVAVLGDDETTLVPLFSGSDLIGVLVTTERPPEGYLLSSLLFHTGIFFERIGTRVESRAREHVLRAIESLGMAALAGVDPERLTSGVLERLSDHWRSDVAILVTGGDGRSVLAVHPSGVLPLEPGSTVDMAGLEPPPDGSVLLKDLEAEGAACPLENLLRGNGVRSVLSVSLRRVEGPTDTVILCRRGGEPFGRAEARGLGEMAAAISLAMARVSDLKRVAHLRITHETVLERAPDGIIVVRDGRVVLANEALTRMLGRNRDALVGIDPVALAAENDRETFAVMLSAAGGPSGSPIEGDIRMIRGDGTSLGLHLVCTSVEHEGGPAVLAFLRHPVVSQEGTAVRAGPVASLRPLFDDATDAVLLLSLEEGGTPGPIDYANRAAGLLLGREANDLQGVSIGDILPGEAMEGITGHLAGLPEDRHATFETEFGTADGERVPVRVEVHLVGDDGARQVLIVARDLRPIRRLERERDAGRALLEAILGSAGEGIIVMDRDLVIRRLNDSIRLALGGAEEVLTGMPLADLIDESDREQIIALLRDVLEGDLSQGPFRIAMRTADGGRVTFDARAATARAPDTQVVLVLRDTSQEERLRAALEESEARRSEVLEKALDAVLWLDASGAITSANAAAHGTLGRPVEEIVGKGLAECLQPEDRRALEDALKGIPEGESRDVPLRFERPDGETRWTWARFQPAAGGGTLVFLKDVTTWAQETEDVRRRKEEVERELTAVRASVASAVDLLEALDELCLRISRENHITWANTRFLRMAGLRPADLRGMQWSDIVPVIRRGEANAVLETSDTFEFPILVAKGGDLQVRWRAVAAEDGHYLIGTPVLEKEAPPVVGGVVRFRMNTGGELEEMSGDVEGLLGYGAGEALEIPYFFTKVAHPADAERIKKKLLKLIKFREFIPKDEYRVVRKDGRTVHVREHLEPIYDGSGKLVGLRGELRDITGEREERETLRERLSFVTSVLDTVPDTGVIAIDLDRTVLHLNRRAAEMVGMPEEAVIGKAVETLFMEGSEVIEILKDAIRGQRAAANLSTALSDGRDRYWACVSPRKVGTEVAGYVLALRPLE